MALSNWDTFAVDQDGKPTNGVFKSGTTEAYVEIYKNWIYLHDPKAWYEGGPFVTDTVAQINSGDIRYGGLEIFAKRSPLKNGVLVVVTDSTYENERAMFGVAVYGYLDMDYSMTEHEGESGEWVTTEGVSYAWLGVEPSDVAMLRSFVLELAAKGSIHKRFAEIDLSQGIRFNQGDAFFAGALDSDELMQATSPGDAEQPILHQMLENNS